MPGARGAAVGGMAAGSGAAGGAAGGLSLELVDIVGAAGGVALAPGAGGAAAGATALAPCVGLVPGARAGTARLQAPKRRRLLACAPMLCGEGLGAPHSRQDAFLANCKSRQPGQYQSPGCGVSLLSLL